MFSTLTFTNWNRFWWKVSWWSYMHRFCHEVPMMVICLTANIASKKHAQCSNQPRGTQINQLETVIDARKIKTKMAKHVRPHGPHTQPIILTGHLNISHVFFFLTNDITCDFHHYSASRFDTPPVFNQVLAVGFWGCKSWGLNTSCIPRPLRCCIELCRGMPMIPFNPI